MKRTAFIALAFLPAPLVAQTGMEQAAPPPGAASDLQVGKAAGDPVGLPQIAPQAADLGTGRSERRMPQAVDPTAGRSPVAQMRRTAADRDTRVAPVSPVMVDACTEAALGRRAAPKGVDCSKVLEANPRPSTSDLSNGESLEAGFRSAGNEVSIRRLENADPEEIAHRLASGYLVNAPAAQAIGAGQQQQAPGQGVIVIPDPSRSPNAPPPVLVNPGPR